MLVLGWVTIRENIVFSYQARKLEENESETLHCQAGVCNERRLTETLGLMAEQVSG